MKKNIAGKPAKPSYLKNQIGSIPGAVSNFLILIIFEITGNGKLHFFSFAFGNVVQTIIGFYVHSTWTYKINKEKRHFVFYVFASIFSILITSVIATGVKIFFGKVLNFPLPLFVYQFLASAIMSVPNKKINETIFK